jgi:hypothetical protein
MVMLYWFKHPGEIGCAIGEDRDLVGHSGVILARMNGCGNGFPAFEQRFYS